MPAVALDDTEIEPLVPEPEPEATPEQDTLAEVAFEVLQVNVLELPTPMVEELKYDDAEGAATDVRLSEPELLPPPLVAVTVQVPEPVPTARTLIEPLVPVPEPDAVPEQDTDAEDAPLVFQVNVVELPFVSVRLLNAA